MKSSIVLGAAGLCGVLAFALFAFGAAKAAKDVVKEPTAAPAQATDGPASPLDFTMKDIDGAEKKLSDLKGNVVLMVNVASKCGQTKQYTALEALYEKYKGKGFVIVGFPANNFGGQEPGDEKAIKQFCSSKYNVTFPMMSKISVKGDDKAPLYHWLTEEKTNKEFAGEIGWNFTKFLVDRNGNVIARFNTPTQPGDQSVVEAIEKALAAKGS